VSQQQRDERERWTAEDDVPRGAGLSRGNLGQAAGLDVERDSLRVEVELDHAGQAGEGGVGDAALENRAQRPEERGDVRDVDLPGVGSRVVGLEGARQAG
jgi:hypothetical protein